MTKSTIMLDSWAWIAYLQSDPRALPVREMIDGTTNIIASAMNVAEVCTYLLRNRREEFLGLVEDRAHIYPMDERVAQESAKIKVSHNLGMADAIILATARAHGATLITCDPDFKGMEGVEYLGE